MEERIQKILARAGYGSRRACEQLIRSGRVTVNGQIAKLGQKGNSSHDSICIDGSPIELEQGLVYIALYKPRGVISSVTSELDPRPTVLSLVSVPERVYPVGRLDVDSEGLILLTNDGDLTYRLTHPRFGHDKEYKVLVDKLPDKKQLSAWRHGIVLSDGYQTAPVNVKIESVKDKGVWLRVTLREGRKRQIRESGALLGLSVRRIIRIRISSLKLGNLNPGQWRFLSDQELSNLKRTILDERLG
jgi:23S rRNA pseudouridine2605 synthase